MSILLSVDKTNLANDWNDVAFVTATVTDENGVIVPNANDLINFDAQGAGFIAVVDGADNADHDSFQATKRKAFQGKCLAMVKANRNTGKISVTARAANLSGNSVMIKAGR